MGINRESLLRLRNHKMELNHLLRQQQTSKWNETIEKIDVETTPAVFWKNIKSSKENSEKKNQENVSDKLGESKDTDQGMSSFFNPKKLKSFYAVKFGKLRGSLEETFKTKKEDKMIRYRSTSV